MDKYRLVGERKSTASNADDDKCCSDECEVRITQQGKPRNYISYAMNLFANGSEKVVLKAMGRAINKAVTIAEILKRKLPLHQDNCLTSSEIIDVFEPIEEGLDMVESKRYVSCMTIILSTTDTHINKNSIGYQPPLSAEEIRADIDHATANN